MQIDHVFNVAQEIKGKMLTNSAFRNPSGIGQTGCESMSIESVLSYKMFFFLSIHDAALKQVQRLSSLLRLTVARCVAEDPFLCDWGHPQHDLAESLLSPKLEISFAFRGHRTLRGDRRIVSHLFRLD